MSTFTESAHPRAGDGKFEAKAVSEAPGGTEALSPTPAPMDPVDLGEVLDAYDRQIGALQSDREHLAGREVARAVTAAHPTAARLELERDDVEGIFTATEVLDAHGTRLGTYDDLARTDPTLGRLPGCLGADSPGFTSHDGMWAASYWLALDGQRPSSPAQPGPQEPA
ncbi:hypothetical protein [Isoptericola croceus]|uniref:hypothetical protein n=1 Tax=Isoptericola croceus TaxID=3031406 RepID=UPI0023F6D029|nr:hypothetical protein [Isoptericola croceus]